MSEPINSTPASLPPPDAPEGNMTRRTALKIAGATLGAAAFAKAIAPIVEWTANQSVDEFLQRHYRELSKADMALVLKRLEAETRKDYGAKVEITDVRPAFEIQPDPGNRL